jgi:hypothetical protein
MTTHKPFNPRGAPESSAPQSPPERLEEDAALAGVVAADTGRALEVAGVVAIGLLVCPPLAVLVFLLVVPFLVVTLAFGLILAVLSTPYLLFHHFRARDRGHMSLLTHRFRRAAEAVIDLAPHRIVAEARRLHPHP